MGFFHRNPYLLTWRIWGIVKTPSILLTFGVEMRAYGQKLVQFCKHTHTHKHTHTRVSYSSIDIYIYIPVHSVCFDFTGRRGNCTHVDTGSRLRTYTELQEHLKTHPNVCVTCYRVFSSRSNLLAHTCTVGEYLCEICQRSYSTQTKLARHKRETSCRHSMLPEAKRQKPMPPIEDLEAPPPPLVDEYGSEIQDVIIQHWGSIRTHTSHGPVQSRYNFRLMNSDIGGLDLGHIFADQTTAFKSNLSFGFILRNKLSGRYRFYHSSCNYCGRYPDEPSLITNAETFETFLERIKEPNILK